MEKIKVMVNGLPGKVAEVICRHTMGDSRFSLVPHSLTGPEITEAQCLVEGTPIRLVHPENHQSALKDIMAKEGSFLTVDYTHPSAVNANAGLYCELGLPFVMGTTGGDRQALIQLTQNSGTPAVIAPNMVKQIVGLTAMMEYAATNFPGLFDGWDLSIVESHQQGKADTSGTAKALATIFMDMGARFSMDRIQKERDPQIQEKEWGVPKEYLKGHGYHTYTLESADKTLEFAFTHNVNGREIYAAGTLDALVFLAGKIRSGARNQVYSMIDVLKGAPA